MSEQVTIPKKMSLRQKWLLALLVLGLVLLAWLGGNGYQVYQRSKIVRVAETRLGGVFMAEHEKIRPKSGEVPRIWGWLGAEPVPHVLLPRDKFDKHDAERVGLLFPEADIYLTEPFSK